MRIGKVHIVVLSAVSAWAVSAWAYVGVEDGSSGLSPVGWVAAAFFLPGGFFVGLVKGSHSNSDLPWMAVVSWLVYGLAAGVVAQAIHLAWRRLSSLRG